MLGRAWKKVRLMTTSKGSEWRIAVQNETWKAQWHIQVEWNIVGCHGYKVKEASNEHVVKGKQRFTKCSRIFASVASEIIKDEIMNIFYSVYLFPFQCAQSWGVPIN